MRRIPTLVRVSAAGLLTLALVGCDSRGTPIATATTSRPPSPSASPGPTGGPVGSPTPSGRPTPTFGEVTAVACNGFPTTDQVLAVLRRTDVLPAGAPITVQTPPQCAGDWQFTVVSVPDREPLQVVTRGVPAALQLVTAGTDVCNIPVRTRAPEGIITLARCR